MNKLLVFFLAVIFLFSCNNKNDEIVVEFLNNTEKEFDKNKFEMVSLDLLDTIYELDIFNYSDYSDYPKVEYDAGMLDTVAVPEIQQEVYWYSEPYSKAFYNFLRYNGENSDYIIDYDGNKNSFLNSLVKNSYEEFRKKFLKDDQFQIRLKDEIKQYPYFKGVFSSDSLLKFIYLENVKSKKLYGFLYQLTYRSNSILHKKKLIFNSEKNRIIAFKGDDR